jgi:hypothetical protein
LKNSTLLACLPMYPNFQEGLRIQANERGGGNK